VSVPLGGLAAAVAETCERARGAEVALTTVGDARDVPPETAAVVLRVLNEALVNAERHAAARHVAVRLTFAGEHIGLAVADDGIGLPGSALPGAGDGHFGLTIMRERARSAGGRVEIAPGVDGGTLVTLEVPVT
jgi:signal transduction histidine kinase